MCHCDGLMTANRKSLLSMVAFKKVGDSILTIIIIERYIMIRQTSSRMLIARSHYLSSLASSITDTVYIIHGMWNLATSIHEYG